MSTVTLQSLDPVAAERLRAIYIATMRQRFKAEVNRLTSGAMLEMLHGNAHAVELAFPLTYLYAYHWLRQHVAPGYFDVVLAGFRSPARTFLMDLLVSPSAADFVAGYIAFWQHQPPQGPLQRTQLLHLLAAHAGDSDRLGAYILEVWQRLGQFAQTPKTAYAALARDERQRYGDMLGDEDRERLAMVDRLSDPGVLGGRVRFTKLGLIPVMGCPQTCRHCMFIWRPLKPSESDPDMLYRLVDDLTDSVLFTGGDLTRHLEHFYAAIGRMRQIKTFAILLNGDFADDRRTTEQVLKCMAAAIAARPRHWAKARVLLQISFDEFHQEVYVDKHGRLRERIPVAKIAHIVELAPCFAEHIQLALLHKQTALNFSMDVLHKGVFGRLVEELGGRGHQIQVLTSAPSARLKRNPHAPDKLAPILTEASFVLTRYPDAPILLTSSTIDGYGRAELLDESETVKERELLHRVLTQGAPAGERFDIDLMFWFNGWATLFNAVHICLGDVYEEGAETILARQRKDPLSHALHLFDRRLPELYAEVRTDFAELLDKATGPHHLFHMLTEDPQVRLHMTRRLIEQSGSR